MITSREKALLHIYAAGVDRPTYCNILREHAGVSSSADPAMTQGGFRRAMAAIEIRRETAGLPPPRGYRTGYWQSIVPVVRAAVGHTKVRLIHSLIDQLSLTLPGLGHERDQYIQASVDRAAGRRVESIPDLTDRQADAVIACLRALLVRHPLPDEEPVPF